MLSALHGQLWNASEVGRSMGISYHTVNAWLEVLEGAFLVRRLDPLHANLAKRLTKRPKVFIRDAGLLHSLARVRTREDLLDWPLVGASYEGFVIEQLHGALVERGIPVDVSFFRTSDGHECDLVLGVGRERIAVDVKLTSSPSPSDMARLVKVGALLGATRHLLISKTEAPAGDETRRSTHLADAIARLVAWAGG